MTLHTPDCQRPPECCCCFHCSTEYRRCLKSKEPENQVDWLQIEKEEFVNTCTVYCIMNQYVIFGLLPVIQLKTRRLGRSGDVRTWLHTCTCISSHSSTHIQNASSTEVGVYRTFVAGRLINSTGPLDMQRDEQRK